MMEDRGGTHEEEPHHVDQKGGGRRAVAVEVILHCLDSIFAVTTDAIVVFVEYVGGGSLT